jgi:predicted nucleic acid-binding protein
VILLDTSVLSLAFRRRGREGSEPEAVASLQRLIEEDAELAVPGIVVQELLSGLRTESEFARLEDRLSGFPVLLADEETHRSAARLANACRAAGIAASTVDCLIAAQALASGAALFTLDQDFSRMTRCAPLELVELA